MSDITFLIPRAGYTHYEIYNLIDAILYSMGFTDEGLMDIGGYAYARYSINSELLKILPRCKDFKPHEEGPANKKICIYSLYELPEPIADKLSEYGLDCHGITNLTVDHIYWQYCIDQIDIPKLAKIAPNGVRPSKRYVEEAAYYHWMENGRGVGTSHADWFAAEWEANEQIQEILRRLQ